MTQAVALIASPRAARRAESPTGTVAERLGPARGIMLGLGLSAGLWAGLVALVLG